MTDNEKETVKTEVVGENAWTKYETYGVLSLVFAIISVILSWIFFYPIWGIVFALVALVFSIVATVLGKKSKKSTSSRIRGVKSAGLVIGIIGIVLSAIAIVLAILFSTIFAALIAALLGIAEEMSSASVSALAILL